MDNEKNTYTLSDAEAGLMNEINGAMTNVQLRQLQLKEQEEQLKKALEEAQASARAAILLIQRQNALQGNWQISDDFKTLNRVN